MQMCKKTVQLLVLARFSLSEQGVGVGILQISCKTTSDVIYEKKRLFYANKHFHWAMEIIEIMRNLQCGRGMFVEKNAKDLMQSAPLVP